MPSPNDKEAPRWGFVEVVIGIFAAAFVSQALPSTYITLTGSTPTAFSTRLLGILGVWMAFLGVPWLASRYRGSGRLALDFGLRFQLPRDALYGLALGVFAQLVLVQLIYLPLRILNPELYDKVDDVAKEVTNFGPDWQLAVIAIGVVAIAPLVEEVFFRGLTQRAFARRFGPRVTVVSSGVVFALVHWQGLQFPALLGFGLFLAVIAQRTGRLGINIFAHAGFNGVTVIQLLFLRYM